LGEADKLVTLFTAYRGKIRAVAKGARRTRSRFGASLEPFAHVNVVLFERRPGVLLRINQTEILHSFIGIWKNLEAISIAARMVRLVSMLTPIAEANAKIFHLLLKGLHEVEKNERDLELLTRFFEIHLLKHSGYLPRVDRCLKCEKSFGPGPIFFAPGMGGTICGTCHRNGSSGLHEVGEPVSGGTIAFLAQSARLGWDQANRLRAAGLVRTQLQQILEASIEHITGRFFSRTPIY
jgi:DNA repair protein RecO (recombination protein O)